LVSASFITKALPAVAPLSAPIPTLGETALALLALLLGASAVAVKRRGR
jgi:hypothetical protein